jgi:hypothetical protein
LILALVINQEQKELILVSLQNGYYTYLGFKMRIKQDLSTKIMDAIPQLKRLGVGVGYSHPMGHFVSNDDDFVIYETDNEVFFILNNEYDHEHIGFLVQSDPDLEQRSESIDNFLIDFHLWSKNGTIKPRPPYSKWKNYEWRIHDDSSYDVIENYSNGGFLSYIRPLDRLPEDLRNHILDNIELKKIPTF